MKPVPAGVAVSVVLSECYAQRPPPASDSHIPWGNMQGFVLSVVDVHLGVATGTRQHGVA